MKAIGFTIISVVAALSLVGLGAAVASGHSASGGATVSTARTGLGRIIVDGRGRSLYLFERDRRGHSACSATCAVYWPPLRTHGRPIAAGGREAVAARDDPARRRHPPGHVCRPPGLPLHRRHEAGPDQGRRLADVRRRLGCALAGREEDRARWLARRAPALPLATRARSARRRLARGHALLAPGQPERSGSSEGPDWRTRGSTRGRAGRGAGRLSPPGQSRPERGSSGSRSPPT